jgi:hypothetical protein
VPWLQRPPWWSFKRAVERGAEGKFDMTRQSISEQSPQLLTLTEPSKV